ncbi:MAG: hypothetical protein AB4057_18760 [Crocosphaera sp.]
MDTQHLPNNSAKRLLEILLSINHHLSNEKTSNHSSFYILSCIFDIEQTPNIVYSKLVKIFVLIENVENEIESLPKLKIELYFKILHQIKGWLSIENFNKSWPNSNENLRHSESLCFQMLYSCAIDLGEQEVIINQEQLNELKDQISSLLENIIESDLSQPLKSLLREKLIELRKVVEDYQFYGPDGIRKIAEESLGALMMNNSEVKAEPDKKPLQEFLKLLKDILDIATKTKQLLPEGIGETLKNLLPPG